MLDFDDVSNIVSGLAEKVVGNFTAAGLSLSAAESCTGGMFASAVVSIPRASAVFKGSAVCYCDAAKMRVLSVPAEILEAHFAESRECAAAMACGAMEIFSSDFAVSTTGFMDSNVGDKPEELAGCAFVAVARRSPGVRAELKVEKIVLNPSAKRDYNRACVVACALKQLVEFGK